MGDAILWGLVQGLTEFLPISSSGHLVLVPAFLGREGPDLATSAVLHLGTLVAVLAYFRRDVGSMVRFDKAGKRLLLLVVIGTIPAGVIGLSFEEEIDELVSDPRWVGLALLATGLVLIGSRFLRKGAKGVSEVTPTDAVAIGGAQAIALIPGVSRSGITITAGMARKIDSVEAARFSFILGIPAIAAAGLLSIGDVVAEGFDSSLLVGLVVAAVSGYAAIAILLRLLSLVGLTPFGIYCVVVGSLAMTTL